MYVTSTDWVSTADDKLRSSTFCTDTRDARLKVLNSIEFADLISGNAVHTYCVLKSTRNDVDSMAATTKEHHETQMSYAII